MSDLLQLATKWLELEKLTGPQISHGISHHHYLWVLSHELQRWVSHGEPQTMDQLVEMLHRGGVAKSRGALSVWKAKALPN